MGRVKKQAKLEHVVQPPRLGVMSNLFRGGAGEVAAILFEYGLESVQILPNFPDANFANASDFETRKCQAIGTAFVSAGLVVAGVTAHTNFVDPDRSRRKRLIKRFDAVIEHCQDFNTNHVITESGTFNASQPWDNTPENHEEAALTALVRSLAPSVNLAEQLGVVILLEGNAVHVLDSVDRAVKLREEFGEHVAFVIDPPNYFTRKMASAPKRHLHEVVKVLGPMGPVAHGKDVRASGNEVKTPRAGTGSLDYKEYLELLDQYQPGCPLILEQLRPEELRETIDFIDRFFDEI